MVAEACLNLIGDPLHALLEAAISRGNAFRHQHQFTWSYCKINDVLKTTLLALAICLAASAENVKPIVDNERVTVWDVTWTKGQPNPLPPMEHDFVDISLTKRGTAVSRHKGDTPGEEGERTVVVELKDHPVAPLENKSGYPNAFPRPRVKKLIDNNRFTVWSYRWNPGEATPMHFHDKDVVVVYMEDTALKSTAPDGKFVINEYKSGQTKFNLRNRIHSELLMRGTGSAVMVELK
jgi:hypothetical protein